MMIGTLEWVRTDRATSSPDRSGSIRSSTMRSGCARSTASRARGPGSAGEHPAPPGTAPTAGPARPAPVGTGEVKYGAPDAMNASSSTSECARWAEVSTTTPDSPLPVPTARDQLITVLLLEAERHPHEQGAHEQDADEQDRDERRAQQARGEKSGGDDHHDNA